MSVIQAGNTTTTSLIYTGDTTGNLVFTTGGANTVALTLANTQAATFSGTVTANLVVSTGTVNAQNTFGFENRIINGDMRIWQRSTTFTNVASVYTADRWTASVSSNMTVSQSTDVPNVQYKYSLSMVPAANATPSEFVIRQFIEQQNIFDFAGQTVTGSAWVKCSKSTIRFRLGTQNATGGNDSAQTISVTAGAWTKITYTFTTVFSSITAWTSTPNAAGAFLDIGFVNSTALTTSDYLYFTGVQLELGSQATSFDFRSITNELQLCQRYYTTSYGLGVAIGTATVNGLTGSSYCYSAGSGVTSSWIGFPVQMRTSATISYWDSAGTVNKASQSTGSSSSWTNAANLNVGPYAASPAGFQFQGDAGNTNRVTAFQYAASAEF
jgi:hypothetical protein